jgi:hypothetical protein
LGSKLQNQCLALQVEGLTLGRQPHLGKDMMLSMPNKNREAKNAEEEEDMRFQLSFGLDNFNHHFL